MVTVGVDGVSVKSRTRTVAVVVRVTPPKVPEMFNVYVPAGVLLDVFKVNVEAPVEFTDAGLKL